MNFGSPDYFYLLLLIPVIILLNLLFRKRKRHVVSSLLIWDRVLSERRFRYLLYRIFSSLILLLQILVVGFIVISAADPGIMRKQATKTGRIILIIDTSASMQAGIGMDNRFDLARDAAFDLIDEAAGGEGIMIISAGGEPMIHAQFTRNSRLLDAAVSKLYPADVSTRMDEALRLAFSFYRPKDEIVIVSDGAFSLEERTFVGDFNVRVLEVEGLHLADSSSNMGITAFEFRKPPAALEAYEIFITIVNYSGSQNTALIRLYINENLFTEQEVVLAGGMTKNIVIPYSGLLAGTAEVRLLPLREDGDILAADNTAYAVLRDREEISVRLVTGGNFFLESFFDVYPGVSVNREAWAGDVLQEDLLVLDGADAPDLPDGSFFLIDTIPRGFPAVITSYERSQEISYIHASHPVTDGVHLDYISISEVPVIAAGSPDWKFTPLIGAGKAVLLYAFEGVARKGLYIPFNIAGSDFPLQPAFPVLMANGMNWLFADDGHPPDEIVEERESGFHRLEREGRVYVYAANLTDPEESNVTPRFTLPEHTRESEEQSESLARRPLWIFFGLMALACLLLEWILLKRETR
jgi:Ca-activated chloride channel homolog